MSDARRPRVPTRPAKPAKPAGADHPVTASTRPHSSAARASRTPTVTARPSAPAHRPQPGSGTTATPWVKVAASAAARKVTTRMQERLDERRTAERRLALRRWAIRAAIAGGAAGAVWLALLSPVFSLDLDDVETTGLGTVVDESQVEEILAAYEGESLGLMNTGGIAAQLRELTGVRDAEVVRVWPAGLQVVLTPSEPVAAIPRGEAFALVDDHGDVVNEAEEAPPHLPVISIPTSGDNSRILAGVLEVIDELPVELRARVQGIEAETEDSIHFVLRDGPQVEWGSGERSALKAEVLQVLLESDDAMAASVIDVSAPTLPITRTE